MVTRCRRYIREQERLLAEIDQSTELDYLEELRQRASAPIVWDDEIPGIRIMDLQSNRYKDTLNFLVEEFIPEDVLYRNSTILEDPESMEAFEEKAYFLMKDKSSLIAVNDKNQVVGALIMKIVRQKDRSRTFSKVQIRKGKTFLVIQKFIYDIYKRIDLYKDFNCEYFLRYYMIGVAENYRGKQIGHHMMWASLKVARHLKVKVIMGIFPAEKLQLTASFMGMVPYYHYNYGNWYDHTGSLVFRRVGAGNHACTSMAGVVGDPKPPWQKQK